MEKVHGNEHGSKKKLQSCFVDSLQCLAGMRAVMKCSAPRLEGWGNDSVSVLHPCLRAAPSELKTGERSGPQLFTLRLTVEAKLLPSQRSQSFLPLPFEPPTADFTGTLHQKETGGLKGFCQGQTKSPLC